MDSHFCIGHVVGMRLYGFISIYIFLTHVDALLWFLLCEYFYYVVECKCLCDVLLHYACIFRHDYALCCGCMFPIYCCGCANLEYR